MKKTLEKAGTYTISTFAPCLIALCTISLFSACVTSPVHKGVRIDNPYRKVNWAKTPHLKAAMHVHTKASDGSLYPHDVIDRYQALDYDILAITDHNGVTHPWTTLTETFGADYENRDPIATGMKDVAGNELSHHHHMGSYWTRHNDTLTEVASLDATLALGGQTVLFHPGRYANPATWYVDLLKRYDHLKGIEVYNQGDRYPGDRKLWDEILVLAMPDRQVWGFSNDDMHQIPHLGRNWEVFLIPKPSEKWIRKALDEGRFYYVYCPKGHDGAQPPSIRSIDVNARRETITINATGYASIEWISNGKIVGNEASINLTSIPELGSYVRAVLYGPEDDTIVGTQPFGIRRP